MKIKRLAAFAAFIAVLGAPGVFPSPVIGKEANQADSAVENDDPAKFFLFHMAGITPDIARADLTYCIDQTKDILSQRDRMGSGGGLLGSLINGHMANIDSRRMRNASMRKCMNLHGYNRYKVPQLEWKAMVNDGDIVLSKQGGVDPDVIDRMAAFAAGTLPAGERLDP